MAVIVITIALNCDNCNGIARSGGLHDFDEFDARDAGTGGPSSRNNGPPTLGFDRGITPIKWLKRKVRQLQKTMVAMSSMIDSKFLQVGGRIDYVNNTVDTLDGEMDNLGQNVTALDSKVIQVELSIDNVNTTLTNEVNNLESQMEILEQEVSPLIPKGFEKCVDSWCLQNGPSYPQYTKCESTDNGGNTCINPEIRYGSVTGGIPREHSGNQYNTWCEQLGSWYISYTIGTRTGYAVFGCTEDDWDTTWHWCDYADTTWYNQSLDFETTDVDFITSITCGFNF